MKSAIRIIICTTLMLIIFTAQSLSDSIKYYSPDHTEISVEEYNAEARKYQKKYLEAKKNWGYVKSESLRQCIEYSGWNHALLNFPEEIDALAANGILTTGQPAVDSKVLHIIKDSFDLDSAHKKYFAYCKRNMNKRMVKEVLAWFKSPLGRKISNEENAASSVEARTELLGHISELQKNPPPQDRVLYIEKFVETSKIAELFSDIAMKLIEGITVSINLAYPEERRIDKERIETIINKIKPGVVQQMRQHTTLRSYYIYRNISNEELGAYIKFLSSDNVSKFYRIGAEGIGYVYAQHFDDIKDEIVSRVPPVEIVAESGPEIVETVGGFSFAEPPGWNLSEVPGLKYKVAFDKPIDGFAPNILTVDELYRGDLESYVVESENNLRKTAQNYKQIGKNSFQTNTGLSGIKLTTQIDQQGNALRQTFYFFSGYGDIKYVVTCSVTAAHAEKFDSVFDSSLKTFSLNK